MHQPLEEIRARFETNVLGLVSTTQAFLPLLGAGRPQTHPPGRIVNISSVSGRVATPFTAAYNGTKHTVKGVSDSLRRTAALQYRRRRDPPRPGGDAELGQIHHTRMLLCLSGEQNRRFGEELSRTD